MDNIEDILRALVDEESSSDTETREENSSEDSGPGLFSGMDIGTMAKLAGLLGAASSHGDDERFLLALKPLLREENRSKVDTAVRLLKIISLIPLLKDSGLFGQGE